MTDVRGAFSDVEPSPEAPSDQGEGIRAGLPSPDLDWHEWRRQGIGGSDIAGLLGLSRYSSPTSIYYEKVGLLPPTEETQRQRIGKRMEAVLEAEFHDETGLYVRGQQTWRTHLHPSRSWMRTTLDGLVFENPESVYDLGTFEAKTDGRTGWPDGIPANYRAQGLWQLAVTEMERVWFGVMFSNWRFEVFELERDDDDIAFMIDRASKFWYEHVLKGIAPEPDDSEATSRALGRLWPEHEPGKEADVDPRLVARWLDRRELRLRAEKRAKAAKAREDALKNQIVEAAQDAEFVTVGGEQVATLRSVPPVEVKAFTRAGYRTLRPKGAR